VKLNAVQDVERNAVRAAMLEERARFCLFIGAIKPLIVRIGRIVLASLSAAEVVVIFAYY